MPAQGGHDKPQKGAGLLHEAFDVGDGIRDAVLEVPDAGEGLAVTFEDNAVVQDEDLARIGIRTQETTDALTEFDISFRDKEILEEVLVCRFHFVRETSNKRVGRVRERKLRDDE